MENDFGPPFVAIVEVFVGGGSFNCLKLPDDASEKEKDYGSEPQMLVVVRRMTTSVCFSILESGTESMLTCLGVDECFHMKLLWAGFGRSPLRADYGGRIETFLWDR